MSKSFVQRVAERVGVQNPQSASELLAGVDRALVAADARRAAADRAAAAALRPKTQAQLDQEFDDALAKNTDVPRYAYSAQADAEYRAMFGDES